MLCWMLEKLLCLDIALGSPQNAWMDAYSSTCMRKPEEVARVRTNMIKTAFFPMKMKPALNRTQI